MAINDSQQRLLRTMLTGIPGLLALKNKQLAYEVVNPAFSQFLGRAAEDIIGKKDADLFPAEEAKLCQQAENTIFKTGLPRLLEQSLTGVEGKRWIDITRAPVLDENGDPAGILIFARDITDFKQREEELSAGLAKQKDLEQRAADAVEQLQAQQEASQRAIQAAAKESEAVKAQVLEKDRLFAETQGQLQNVQKKLQEREAELLTLAKQLQAAQAQLAKAAECEQRAAALQQELQKAQALLAEHQRMGEQKQKELADLQQHVNQMQAALAKSQAQCNAAAALAQQLMNTLQS
ncbi:MAG TPA: PAS domain-containing protein [Candidatus Hydrogenedentes bacterium]|nr:PAS domain-containing protein [Candidatus Hydrogenedentota bacterium]